MYFKLALRNVKKSYKDYLIYFMTLTFSVALFYVFNSFESQSSILDLDAGTAYMIEVLVNVMTIMSVVVSVIFGFLIIYANNFLIKRRKKELGMYTLLGMPAHKINLVLIYETILIGLASLFTGIILGVFLSQGSATLSARLIDVPVNFSFVFSFYSVIVTSISFAIIFLITGFFNLINLRKQKLIDLLKAEKINETSKIKSNLFIFIILTFSLFLLITAYIWVLKSPEFLEFLWLIIIMGSLATFGIFFSLASIIMKLPKLFTKYYYKDLNTFVFRQVGSKINSTYRMMAIISLMLLMGIGALATSFNINSILVNDLKSENPYGLTVGITYKDGTSIEKIRSDIKLDEVRYEKEYVVDIYHSGIELSELSDQIISKRKPENMDLNYEVAIVNLDQYNNLRKSQGLKQQTLSENEIIYFSSAPLEMLGMLPDGQDNSYKFKDKLSFADLNFNVKDSADHQNHKVSLMNSISFQRFFLVMNDNDLDKVKENRKDADRLGNSMIFNLDFYKDQSIEELLNIETDLLFNLLDNDYSNILSYNFVSYADRSLDVRESTLLFTYVGLYLGLTFVISSAVILSLQLVSEASDNQRRYQMLSRLGVSDEMSRKSIFKQNLLYFTLPMLLALIHSWVGITAINRVLSFGLLYTSDNRIILLTTGFVLLVYIMYFLFTYKSSVTIIEDRSNQSIL